MSSDQQQLNILLPIILVSYKSVWYSDLCLAFNQCFGSGFFFRIRIGIFFLSPDLDRPKIRIRSGKIRIRIWIREKNVLKLELKKKKIYFISSTRQHCPFWSGSSKTLSNPSFRSYKFIHRRIRIRTFKTRIRIGEKTRILPDPEHCCGGSGYGEGVRGRGLRVWGCRGMGLSGEVVVERS